MTSRIISNANGDIMFDEKVSVIIPVYNSAAYLPACLESIMNQTYKNIEILLIDDGSVDNSLQICKDFARKDSRIKVWHQENRGVSAARNAGMEIADGKYITFVDSDDQMVENGISILVNDLEECNADIAAASQFYITSEQTVVERHCEDTKDVMIFTGIEALCRSLDFDRRMTSCHGKLFRREFLQDIRFAEGKKVNEDFYFVFLCCLKQPVFIYRDECVYKYFYRACSVSHSKFEDKYFDMLYFAEQKKQIIEARYPELLDKAVCMEISTHLFMLNVLCKAKSNEYADDERKSIEYVKKHYNQYSTQNPFEKRLSWIVAHGLYPLYKWAVRMKYYR